MSFASRQAVGSRSPQSNGTRQTAMPDRTAACDDRELFARHRTGDPAAREELARRHLRLAQRLASRYANAGVPMEDLVQVASLGLLRAIDRFEPDMGNAFSTFAVPTILGELRRYIRDTSWAVHVPRCVQELTLGVRRAEQELSVKLGRSPSPSELAAHMGERVEQVLEARQAVTATRTVSLDAPGDESEEHDQLSPLGRLGAEDQGYSRAEGRTTVGGALASLPKRERALLHMRFSLDMTQSEIADRIGVSQMHVSRLLRRTLDDLHELTADRTAAT
jgi:RNA polymerase sigma-B factor